MTSRSLTEMVSLHLPRHAACAPHSVLECAFFCMCVCRSLRPGPASNSLFAALDRGEGLSLWGWNDARKPELAWSNRSNTGPSCSISSAVGNPRLVQLVQVVQAFFNSV